MPVSTAGALLAAALWGPPQVEIRWSAPADCPAQADVIGAIERYLGRPVPEAATEPLGATAVVTHDVEAAQPWRLELTTKTGEGARTRVVGGASCDELADATALIVAVTIDPEVGERLERPDPAPRPTPRPEPAEQPLAEPEPAPPQPSEPTAAQPGFRGAIRVVAQGTGAILPGFSPGIAASLAFVMRFARIDAFVTHTFDRTARIEAPASGRGDFRLTTAGVRGCGVPSVSVVEFPLCAGVEAGAMRGEGRGIGVPQATTVPYVALSVGAEVAYLPSRYVALVAGADLLVPVVRPRFSIDDETVHHVGAVGGLGRIGLEARFP